jgi:hypothetical protein
MVKSRWNSSVLSLCFLFIISFTVVRISGSDIWLYADRDLTTGTDAACEAYWETINSFLQSFSTIHITNKGWIPSPKVIIRSHLWD